MEGKGRRNSRKRDIKRIYRQRKKMKIRRRREKNEERREGMGKKEGVIRGEIKKERMGRKGGKLREEQQEERETRGRIYRWRRYRDKKNREIIERAGLISGTERGGESCGRDGDLREERRGDRERNGRDAGRKWKEKEDVGSDKWV